ncbi:MAG: PKD domain-containing protein, partial [Methanobacteriota archaeon]
GMNKTKTERAFQSAPPALVLSTAWPDPSTIVLQLERLRSATRYVWGFGCTAADSSDPGNPLANCQDTHDFTTESGIPTTSIRLLSPVGGESWTGGSARSVRFSITNAEPATDVFPVNTTYRYAGGTQGGSIGIVYVTVPGGGTLDGQVSWTAPVIDALDVIVNVTATNRSGATFWDESGLFEIDSTAPTITNVAPALVHPSDPVVVTFSEPMASVLTQTAVSISPSVSGLVFSWDGARSVLTIRHSDFTICATYVLAFGSDARDDSDPGKPLGPPVSWPLQVVCAPTVALLSPNGGEDWTGGSVHTIRWVTTDPDDTSLALTLAYSLDGGADGFSTAIAGPLVVPTGGGSYSWTVPRTDSSSTLIRVTVVDPAGNTATGTSAAVFTIDSTPPALLVSFPSDGAAGHKTTQDLWFAWTERVDRTSFEGAFGLTPDPGGIRFEWSVSNLGGDVLLVSHDPMKSRTTYTATFGTSAKDGSDPGNALAVPVAVRFTTQPPPAVHPPVALAVGHHQVPVGEPTTFDGTGSSGNIRDYVWRVADNHGNFVAVLVGATATYTFQQQGRYSVTLFVTDVNGTVDDDTIEIASLPRSSSSSSRCTPDGSGTSSSTRRTAG